MIFRQLFEPLSSTYTYLLGCAETGQAILIDPVIVAIERDLAVLERLGLKLTWTLETHRKGKAMRDSAANGPWKSSEN